MMTIKELNSVSVDLHDSQGLIRIIKPNILYALWQRGGGKTGGGIGPHLVHLSNVMPRSQVLLFSDTYDRLKKRIVPNIEAFWKHKLGWVEGVDFVLFKKPPDHFLQPLIGIPDYEHVISTSSGMCVCLVSLHVEGSANAYNAQAAVGDEVKFCDEAQINTEVIPAIRGEEKTYGHLPEYGSVWMFTDKFGPKTKWLLQKKKKVNHQAVEMVYVLQMQILQWQQEMEQYTSSKTLAEYKKKIDAYTAKAEALRMNLMYVSEMKPYENEQTLGKQFFRRQKKICTPYEYDVAILNKDPDKVEVTFYPMFSSSHKYSGIQDYNPQLPFVLVSDYNYAISPIPIIQIGPLPGAEYTTINIIDYIYTLYPLGMEDAIKIFLERYKDHQCKEVHYIYDHTAIGRNTLKASFFSSFVSFLEATGEWVVVQHYIGDAPDHDVKFEKLKEYFVNEGEFAIRINMVAAEQLIKSIELSPARIVGGRTIKDKRTEKDPKAFPAEDSTHGSDALDQALWGLFEFNLKDQIAPSNSVGIDMMKVM